MANLYDTPAQAQFINTYVPIQFDSMYKMADKASADMEKANVLMDKLSEYRSLGSLSETANKQWEEKVWNPIQTYIDKNINDVHDLSRPDVISGLRNLQRRVAGSQEARILLESKEAYKQTAAKVDPKWGSHYRDRMSAHNPLQQGIWSENPLEYSDFNKIGDELTKDLGARKIGTKDGGLTEIWGIDRADVENAIASNAAAIVSDPGNIETARAQLARLGIMPNSENYEAQLNNYILEAVSASALDKTNQRTEKTNELALYRQKEANAWARARWIEGKKDERAAKEAKGVVGSITKEWSDRAKADNLEKKISAVNGRISAFRSAVQKNNAGKLTDDQLNKLAREQFGEAAFGYWDSNRKAGWIDRRLNSEKERMSVAAVNGDKQVLAETKANIAKLEADYNIEMAKAEQLMPEMQNFVTEQARSARAGGKSIFSKAELVAFDQYDVPASLSETWSMMNIGEEVEIQAANNTKRKVHQVSNPGTFRYASPVYGNQVGGRQTTGALAKFNDGLINSRGSGLMYFESANKAFIDSDGTSLSGYITVPEEVLSESFGMSASEVAELKKSVGVNSFKGRHIDSNEKEVYERDDKGKMKPAGKAIKTVPMVRIPVSTKFIGKSDSALPSQMVDLEFEKRYKKNNLGVSNIAPTDYEEFE